VHPEDRFAGGGHMGELKRSHDWSATPFGPVAAWPQSLRTAINMMLERRRIPHRGLGSGGGASDPEPSPRRVRLRHRDARGGRLQRDPSRTPLAASEGGRTPAAALTAYAAMEDRMRTLTAGFEMHVAKPVEPAELAAVVASLAPNRPSPAHAGNERSDSRSGRAEIAASKKDGSRRA
jgi:hypothetical protein